MPRRAPHTLVFLLFLVTAGFAGCKSNPVGKQCFIPNTEADGGVPVTVVAGAALECESSTCLHVAGHFPDLCTGSCESADDCDTSAVSPCQGGFACITPTVTGSFCCQKMCVCMDYLPNGIPPEPTACDPSIAANKCCNLPGRDACR